MKSSINCAADLKQCAEYLRGNTESLKYLKELAARSMKICQLVLYELDLPFNVNEPTINTIKNTLEAIVNTCIDSAGSLNSCIFDPIQNFLINYNLKTEELDTQGKFILNEVINLHQTTEMDKNNYYDIKDKHFRACNSLKKLMLNQTDDEIKDKVDAENSKIIL